MYETIKIVKSKISSAIRKDHSRNDVKRKGQRISRRPSKLSKDPDE